MNKVLINNMAEYINGLTEMDRVDFIEELAERLEMVALDEDTDSSDFDAGTNSSWTGYSLGDTELLIDLDEEVKMFGANHTGRVLINSIHTKHGLLYMGEDLLTIKFDAKGKASIYYRNSKDSLVLLKLQGQMKTLAFCRILNLLGSTAEYISTEKFTDGGTFDRILCEVNMPVISKEIIQDDGSTNFEWVIQTLSLELNIIAESQASWLSISKRTEKYYKSMRKERYSAVSTSEKVTANTSRRFQSVIESGLDGIFDANGNLEMQNDAVENAVEVLQYFAPELLK